MSVSDNILRWKSRKNSQINQLNVLVQHHASRQVNGEGLRNNSNIMNLKPPKTHARYLLILINVGVAALLAQATNATIPKGSSVDCNGCHGLYPGMRGSGGGGGGGGTVVLGNEVCVDCHSYTGSGDVKILGGIQVPVVYNYVMPPSPLAGGNFYYLNDVQQNSGGHNVEGAAPPDTIFNGTPPGYYRSADDSNIGYNSAMPLACAGSNGCHGNRNIENPFDAISGTHHATDLPVDGSTTAKSYRYLKITDTTVGVVGLEDPNWGANSTPQTHNEYTISISDLCAQCHGQFHVPDDFGGSSPWLLHPVGITLPNSGEYADYNPDASSLGSGAREYSLDAPVARPNVPTTSSDLVFPGTDLNMCLSCHSAHGTPYSSMLRWDYSTVSAGQTNPTPRNGCLICHTQK